MFCGKTLIKPKLSLHSSLTHLHVSNALHSQEHSWVLWPAVSWPSSRGKGLWMEQSPEQASMSRQIVGSPSLVQSLAHPLVSPTHPFIPCLTPSLPHPLPLTPLAHLSPYPLRHRCIRVDCTQHSTRLLEGGRGSRPRGHRTNTVGLVPWAQPKPESMFICVLIYPYISTHSTPHQCGVQWSL